MEEMKNFSIFILGTTAVGKTKLSLELCKYLNGEIISCDSKQLYKYANLMTAKSTPDQLSLCKHYMVDCLNLQEDSYNRNKFYEHVKTHTQKIWKQGKTPIFIGGTNYYIEPILYNVEDLGRLPKQKNQSSKVQQLQIREKNEEIKDLSWINKLTKQEKYEKLKEVDPLMAQKLHRNDQIRVTSFLERFYKYDKRPSETYKPYTNELNNQNTILFWVRNTDKLEHKVVVSSRIKQMLGRQGILEILSVFTYLDIHYFEKQPEEMAKLSEQKMHQFKEHLRKKLTASGIGQSIGYKQFFDLYFDFRNKLFNSNDLMHNQPAKILIKIYNDRETDYQQIYEKLQKNFDLIEKQLLDIKLLDQSQDQLIRDTWAYCKRQITWIRNRIFLKDAILTKRFYILDLAAKQRKYSQSDNEDQKLEQAKKLFDKKDLMNRFQTKVLFRAISIIDQVKSNGFQKAYEKFQFHEEQFKPTKQEIKLQDWKKFVCKQCEVQINGQKDWEAHISSKRHLKRVKYMVKKQEFQKNIQFHKKRRQQEALAKNELEKKFEEN